MKITKLKQTTKTRYSVYLEGETYFVTEIDDGRHLTYEIGKLADPEIHNKIVEELNKKDD